MVKFGPRHFELAHLSVYIWDPYKSDENILMINKYASNLPIVFKFDRMVRHQNPETDEF